MIRCLAFLMGVDSQTHRSHPWLLLCCLCAMFDGGGMEWEDGLGATVESECVRYHETWNCEVGA